MFDFIDVSFRDILHIPSLKIEESKITSLIGPSGSGKTTILKMLNKMVSPTSGKILFRGKDLSEIDSVDHRRQVSMLSQTAIMFEGNIRQNLTIGYRFQKKEIPGDDILQEIMQWITLDMELDHSVQHLSGGEKQRLALGRIMLLNSPVYLLDEPSASLDDDTAEAIIDRFTAFARRENKTLVLVTHSKSIAKRVSDEIIEVANGKLNERYV